MGFEEYSIGTPEEEFEKALKQLSPTTQQIYRTYLNEFLGWRNASHQELFDWVRELEQHPDPRSRKQLTNMFDDFAETKLNPENIEDAVSMATVLNYRKAIHKFLDANMLTLRIKKNGRKVKNIGKDIITREQIQKLIELAGANLRLRALIMTLKDTGLGVSEIAMLTVEDYHEAREVKDRAGRRFKQWVRPLIRKKTGEEARVCMGPEAITAIDDYIGNRRSGALFLMAKSQPHKDEEGIITSDAGYTEKGEPISPSAVTTSIRHHCRVINDKGYNISAHSFRKLFETSFELDGKLNTGKLIMGKAIPASDEPYLKMGDNLLESYMKVYHSHLLLDDKMREVTELKKQIRELEKGQSDDVTELRSQIDEMKARQDKLLERLKKFVE